MMIKNLPGYLINALLLSAAVFCYCPAAKAQNEAEQKTQAPVKAKVTGVSGNLALYNSVQVSVENLPALLAKEEIDGDVKKIILHLNGYPLPDLPARQLSTDGPAAGILVYDLKRTDDKRQQESWNALLGKPQLLPSPQPKLVDVSVGLENKPIETAVKNYKLQVVSPTAYWIYVLAFLGVAYALVYLARESDLLRDSGPDPALNDRDSAVPRKRKPSERRPYSLARTQMALWFFVILASFMFIWLVTSNLTSLTATVLGLMGISAGTGLAAVAIDSNKRGAIDNQKLELDNKRKTLEADIAQLEAKIEIQPPPDNLTDLKASLAKKKESLDQVKSDLAKLDRNTKPLSSNGFFKDILSDDNGVSFHRFQIFAWTLALIVIFIGNVYKVLSMPEFDSTLLGLMGISSGTYLGFKIPEPRTPPEDQTPPVKPGADADANP